MRGRGYFILGLLEHMISPLTVSEVYVVLLTLFCYFYILNLVISLFKSKLNLSIKTISFIFL